MIKNISILGVTGSIGSSALKIVKNFKDNIHLFGIAANKNLKTLLAIADEYKPEYAVIYDKSEMLEFFNCYEIMHNGVKILSGGDGIEFLCSDKRNDIIINGISGKAGIFPSISILENGINLALANKESIVCAGPLLKELALRNNKRILPVDSEHSALFHLVKDRDINDIAKIILTASGGPFYKLNKNNWHNISKEEALKHPTWKMGNKITIDSATMANKGLEVIEAHYLFNMPYDKINVLIHPQSIIHSMVETIDGEIYAQLGPNDMSIPIQNAVFYPELKNNSYNRLDLSKILKLELIPVDLDKFRMLKIAVECGIKGNLYTAFYNFTNEILVNMFLNGVISFIQIEELMDMSLDYFAKSKNDHLQISKKSIKTVDKEATIIVNRLLKEKYDSNI